VKITILWESLAGYSVSFFQELKRLHRCEIQLIYQPISQAAPYDYFDLTFCTMSIEDTIKNRRNLEELCINFGPDCVLMNSWSYPHYMYISKKLKGYGSYVVSVMDNQWRGTVKQLLGIVSSRWFLKPSIDTFLVAGDRAACFARMLGYDDVMYGCNAADIDSFRCRNSLDKRDPNFLFIGRLKKIKGLDLLVKAYQHYRNTSKQPWGLLVAGTGEMASMLKGIPGIQFLGFVQPSKLAPTMELARCLILPSRFEPWGVVIHEAAAAGLPIIASYICGATTAYVRDGVNGFIISPTVENLTQSMSLITELGNKGLAEMGDASTRLANLWSTQKLADYFYSNIKRRSKGRTFCAQD
jgi:glycosyltransferase involved in cell wall biosynthesis